MSWTFQLQMVNMSFDRISSWYNEFMHRTEMCFRSLHERVSRLETQQTLQAASDEQVERVLRKILEEKFAGTAGLPVLSPEEAKEKEYFVENPIPKPLIMNVASLLVSPDLVPSRAYAETFGMLEGRLAKFPDLESNKRQG